MDDALTSVLSLLRARARVTGRLHAGGQWSLRFPAIGNPKFNALSQGECWFTSISSSRSVRLSAGDAFFIAPGEGYMLSSDPQLAPEEAGPAFSGAIDGVARAGEGDDCRLIGGQIELMPEMSQLLLDQLPSSFVVRGSDDAALDLRQALKHLAQEVSCTLPGSGLLADHYAQILLILLLRYQQAFGPQHGPGWLRALSDERIAKALGAIHRDPHLPWTVKRMASEAGMSRSSFAEAFNRLVAQGPVSYLSDWRLERAAVALRETREPIGRIAAAVGYGSESAFGAAFKRRFGKSPALFRRSIEIEAGEFATPDGI
ncbi:AraC family transcriptional regulator [Sphingomonas xinjiangensis]|uniref:AraC-like DNA-binding protein n=1 Tax=Sphingomonas xinjiangensis TaxID=643568 RepID=A0A840YR77_9SPHN|nr:AraC family transcriptional regulator [Sphingomonas xinjiangensis]MBB5711822.1 AraC-like DNA-binding protein [Sphingomonas xinjiangensis]